jgi:hypothetical protein
MCVDNEPAKRKIPPTVWAIIIISDLAVVAFIVWWFVFRNS